MTPLYQYAREIAEYFGLDPAVLKGIPPILQRLRDEVLEEAATVASRRRAGVGGNCNPACHDVDASEIRALKVSQ